MTQIIIDGQIFQETITFVSYEDTFLFYSLLASSDFKELFHKKMYKKQHMIIEYDNKKYQSVEIWSDVYNYYIRI